jgi:DNA-binding NarL/FixJ family response regulator
LLKDVPPDQLLAAIRSVAAGDAVLAPRITRELLDRFAADLPGDGDDAVEGGAHALDLLTARERDVFMRIAAGESNGEIATRLGLAEATVKTHVTRILAKLELRDRVQLVIYAYEHGVVPH